MIIFTGADKALLERAARASAHTADALQWETFTETKKRKTKKLEFDRLKRDEFDLRALAQRLTKVEKAARVTAAVQLPLGVENA